MAFEISGKIVAIYDTVQRTETFKTREFAIETSEENAGRVFTSYAKFQTTQDRTSILDRVNIGDNVKVNFNIRGTKWVKDGRENYITNLEAWRIESSFAGANNGGGSTAPVQPPVASANDESDLPF